MAYKSPIDLATLGGLSGNPLEAMRMAQQQRSDLRTSEMAQSMGYQPQIGDPGYGKGSMAPSAQINQPAQAVGAPPATGVMTGDMNSSSVENPFEGKTFEIKPSNEMGNAAPLFKPGASNAAAKMYGTPLERQMSMPKSGSVTQMSVKQEKAFGPGSKVYEGGNTAIYKGLKAEDSSPASMVEFERDYVSNGSYANPETALDTGTGQAIADTISSIGASAAGAVSGGEGDSSKGFDRKKARGEAKEQGLKGKEKRDYIKSARRSARKNK